MKEFNLELVRQGKKVTTRCGYEVRIICTDFKNEENTPILALLKDKEEEKEVLRFYTSKGKVFDDKESALDLFIEEDDEWVNIYQENGRCKISKSPYLTQREAINGRTFFKELYSNY